MRSETLTHYVGVGVGGGGCALIGAACGGFYRSIRLHLVKGDKSASNQ